MKETERFRAEMAARKDVSDEFRKRQLAGFDAAIADDSTRRSAAELNAAINYGRAGDIPNATVYMKRAAVDPERRQRSKICVRCWVCRDGESLCHEVSAFRKTEDLVRLKPDTVTRSVEDGIDLILRASWSSFDCSQNDKSEVIDREHQRRDSTGGEIAGYCQSITPISTPQITPSRLVGQRSTGVRDG